MTNKRGGSTEALTAEKTSEILLFTTKRLFSSSESGSCTSWHLCHKVGGPCRAFPWTKAVRHARLRPGHAWRRARTVSGCL